MPDFRSSPRSPAQRSRTPSDSSGSPPSTGSTIEQPALELPARAEGVEYETAATDRILELTEGYPYFLQEYGKHVWNIAAGPTITREDVERAHDLVQLELDEGFFRVRIGRATAAELGYLAAMASLGSGPHRSGEIARALGRSGPQSVAPIRARLIEKGLVYSPAYGNNAFTVPRFDDFLRRNCRPRAHPIGRRRRGSRGRVSR